jgi:ankyrin repeat protein
MDVVNSRTSNDWHAIGVACEDGHSDILEMLLKDLRTTTDTVNHRSKQHGVPGLWYACQNGHPDCVRLLLSDARTTLEALNATSDPPDQRSALAVSCVNRHFDCIDLLLKDVRLEGDKLGLSLAALCQEGEVAIVRLLLKDARTRVVATLPDGNGNALIAACDRGHTKCLELLLDDARTTEAVINARTDAGATALGLACHYGHDDCVSLLLKDARLTGQTVAAYDKTQSSALTAACGQGHEMCVKMLLGDRRLTPVMVNTVGQANKFTSALQIACQHGHEGCAEILLRDARSVVDQRSSDGITALHSACGHSGSAACVELLLSKGADVNLLDDHGLTALDFATDVACKMFSDVEPDEDCAKLLEAAGGTTGQSSQSSAPQVKRQKTGSHAAERSARPRKESHLDKELRALFGGAIPTSLKEALREREQVEHRQELACVG